LICANGLLVRDNQICELCIHKKFPIHGIRYKCYRNSVTESALVTFITGFHKFINTWKQKVTTYIVSNEFSRARLLNSSLQLPDDRIVAKSNFVADPGEGPASDREDFFLFAGRIAKEKGVHVLLEAFAQLPDRKIIIIGDGPEKEFLQNQYSSYQNIHFTGQMDRTTVLETMKKCKAFISPSIWYEVTPFTNLEAFSTGTPVIASRLGSMIDTIKEGYNGLHFTAGDANDLRQKVEMFIQQTEKSFDYYKNARRSYLDTYHPDVHYRAIMKIYENAISAGNV
jgi:glycosyltransferase involved in cell wall biosynthesis